MSSSAKIGLTVLIVFLFFLIGIPLQAAGTPNGVKFGLAVAAFLGIRALWKKPKT